MPRLIEHRARHVGKIPLLALGATMCEQAFEASAISRQAQSTLRENPPDDASSTSRARLSKKFGDFLNELKGFYIESITYASNKEGS